MKLNWKIELPQLLILAAMGAWAAAFWSSAPERIPVHWDASGHVNGYGGRFEGVLFVPLLGVGLYLLLLCLPRLDPGKANYPAFAGAYGAVRIAILAFLAAVYALTQAVMCGHHVPMGVAAPALAGTLFLLLGAVLGKVRPNWFVGVRTPWTLSSKVSWVRTHRLAGKLFIGAGLATLAASFLAPPAWAFGVLMTTMLGSSLVSVVYSYLVWRDDPDKIPPAGTLPA